MIDLSTVEGTDYTESDLTLSFGECEKETFVSTDIVDDEVMEVMEEFHISLWRGLRAWRVGSYWS